MPGGFMMGGAWIIFPIIGIIVMLIFMFMMFGRSRGFMFRRDGHEHASESQRLDAHDSETPLAILKKRYAKGEISKDEYEEMKAEL